MAEFTDFTKMLYKASEMIEDPEATDEGTITVEMTTRDATGVLWAMIVLTEAKRQSPPSPQHERMLRYLRDFMEKIDTAIVEQKIGK